MEKDIYFKQKMLFNPNENNLKVFIYGAGSIGSHLAVGLAKIGIKDITVYDYDVVETENIPAQFYAVRQGETNLFKTECIQYMVDYMTGIKIKTENIKITKDFEPNISPNSIHILAFDNIEARKIIINKLTNFPIHLIDGRIGGFNWEVYYVRCNEDTKEYKKTLEGTFSELECGEKCLWVVNAIISARIITNVIKISKRKQPSYMMTGNAMSTIIINKEEM